MNVPNGPADSATFGMSSQTAVSLSSNTALDSIVVNGGASPYNITAPPTFELAIGGVGITNNSGIVQNFVTTADASGGRGTISFHNSATAGNFTAFTNNASVGTQNEGLTIFYDTSTAGNATFTNRGAPFVGSTGGITLFYDASTAGDSFAINEASAEQGALGGRTQFSLSSSAANGTFMSNGGATEGMTLFVDSSTAGNATLIANGGFRGGVTLFHEDSLGGTARVQLFGNGVLEISYHNPPGLSTGSIEGEGRAFLGANNLTVGTNNLSTTFAGVLQDGGGNFGTGGSLTKIGTGTLILSGANTYTGSTIVNGGRLLVSNSSGSGTGPGAVTANNSGTAVGGVGRIDGPVTVNAGAALLVGLPTAASGTLMVADDVMLNSGAIIQLVVGPSSSHSTLTRLTGTWTFANNQAFDFINLGAQPGVYHNIITDLDGDPGSTASWTITTPGFAGTFAYEPGFGGGPGTIDLTITAAPPPPTTFGNISTRLRVETGDNALIGGFIVTGTQPKRIIVRAIGPSLPLAGALADPVLELRDSSGGLIASNDNWRTGGQEAEIIGTTIPPSNDLESAIVATLPANGSAYTAIVRGMNDGTGIGVVEAYDLDQTANSKLGNISTRGFVQTGDNVLIGGLIVLGQDPLRVIVRAIGPSLPFSGVLADPTLNLHDSNGTLLISNDNWRDDPAQESEIIATGIPPSNDLESAIVRNLTPGSYTAIVRGVNNTTGIAVVEAYGLN